MVSMPIFTPKDKTVSIKELDKLYEAEKIEASKQASKKPQTKDEIHQAKKDNRYYLPVLNINKSQYWESKPKSEREYLTDEKAYQTCIGNCCNVSGLKSACCSLDTEDLEHILGPVPEEWIKDAIKYMNKKTGFKYTRHDFVIDFEEGKLIGQKFFNNHEVFMSKESYPMLRIKANGIRFSCNFLNVQTGLCTIYPIRPEMCRNYYCQYLKKNFFIRDPNSHSKWIMADRIK